MSSRIRIVLVEIARQIPTLLVLGGLFAIGFWGANNNWKLPELPAWWKKADDKSAKSASSDDEDGGKDEKKDPNGPLVLTSDDAAQNAGLEHASANRQTLVQYVEAPAVLDFKHSRHAQLAPRATGTAWRVLVSSGMAIKKGDLLALIASPDLGIAKAEFLSANIQFEIRGKTLARLHSVGEAVPDRQIREAELAVREAKVRLVNAQEALVNLSLPLRLKDLETQSDELIARKIRMLGLPSYLAGEEDLPGNLLPIVAPFDGTVIRVHMVVGEVVSPTQPVVVVADVSRLWIQIDVRLEDVGRLALGQDVVFHTHSTSQSVSGKLTWISAEVDPRTRTVRARAEVDNTKGQLRPATFGKAKILVAQNSAALTVPDSSLQFFDGTHRVFVRLDEKTYDPRIALLGAGCWSHGIARFLGGSAPATDGRVRVQPRADAGAGGTGGESADSDRGSRRRSGGDDRKPCAEDGKAQRPNRRGLNDAECHHRLVAAQPLPGAGRHRHPRRAGGDVVAGSAHRRLSRYHSRAGPDQYHRAGSGAVGGRAANYISLSSRQSVACRDWSRSARCRASGCRR